jgi:citrate lyase subunit beta/citryl-CoA lyase
MTILAERAAPAVALRSLLFAPGNDLRKVAKARSLGADAVVLDLEDAVAAGEKDEALERVVAHLADDEAGAAAKGLLAVRVNASDSGRMERELARVVGPPVDAIVIPKVQSAEELVHVDGMLRALEAAAGLGLGAITLLALVETARGVAACDAIAGAPVARAVHLVFGSADFTSDAGLSARAGAEALLYARSRVVVAAAAAGLPAPLDGPYLALRDDTGLRADCAQSRELGFGGRVTIHPGQLAAVHDVYGGAPAEERARAERIVGAFEEALSEGRASIQVAGEFVDEPMYRSALAVVRQDRRSA